MHKCLEINDRILRFMESFEDPRITHFGLEPKALGTALFASGAAIATVKNNWPVLKFARKLRR